MQLGPLGQNRGNVLCHNPSLTNGIEDGSSTAFPRTGPTFVYSLVKCDVEKPNFEWGKGAEQGFMEAASSNRLSVAGQSNAAHMQAQVEQALHSTCRLRCQRQRSQTAWVRRSVPLYARKRQNLRVGGWACLLIKK